ncbi:MAG: hypothetical protein HC937_02950 [Aquincola sp.]|nr:hypothetical protein [Aquincola sp.]
MAKQNRIAVSKLMIPLSYAAVLSGTVTMISTATNLLVNGMLLNAKGHSMHMFELTWVGLPITMHIFCGGDWRMGAPRTGTRWCTTPSPTPTSGPRSAT